MQMSKLDGRTRLSIELALTADLGEPILLQRQDAEARELGLSGAEVDAARQGRSFDFRRSKALAFALALASGHADAGPARLRAVKAGLDEEACDEIARLSTSTSISASLEGAGHAQPVPLP